VRPTANSVFVKNHKPITFAVIILVLVGFAASSIRAERRFKPAPPPARIVSYFVNAFPPNYPDIALTQHKRGNGLFRLTIDRPTGKVTAVKVLRSTGVKVLDDSAAAAFLQWKAKPNRVHYVVIPVNFIAWD
jgi:TonB family protein